MIRVIQDKLSNSIIYKLAKRYGLEEETLVPCGGYESAVYSFRRCSDEYILKITMGKVKDIREVAGEIEFVNYLYENGFGVSNVIRSLNGNYIERIDLEDDYFYARCYSKAKGYHITSKWSMALFNTWGETMGKLHRLSKNFVPSSNFFGAKWNENPRLNNVCWDEDIRKRVKELTSYLQSLEQNRDNYGIVHNDFHQDNFFINNFGITVIDFDDLGYSWYINDIAVVLYQVIYQNIFSQQDENFGREFFQCFMEGYNKESVVDDSMIVQLPYFLRLRHIILYSAYYQTVDIEHLEKYEERILLKYYRDINNSKELIDFSSLL